MNIVEAESVWVCSLPILLFLDWNFGLFGAPRNAYGPSCQLTSILVETDRHSLFFIKVDVAETYNELHKFWRPTLQTSYSLLNTKNGGLFFGCSECIWPLPIPELESRTILTSEILPHFTKCFLESKHQIFSTCLKIHLPFYTSDHFPRNQMPNFRWTAPVSDSVWS